MFLMVTLLCIRDFLKKMYMYVNHVTFTSRKFSKKLRCLFICYGMILFKYKFWNVQQSHNVHLLPRLTACSLNKVPSIFAYNANKSVLYNFVNYFHMKYRCEEQEEMDISTPNTSICAEEAKIEDDIESTSTDQSLDRSFFKQLKVIICVL